jgi:tripartite-type tricarboxylate transporter receptor subunit TctC
MRLSRRRFFQLATTSTALLAVTSMARSQAFPVRPITIVVPFPAGGPADIIARILAEGMRATLGQPVVIENVAGAGGSIGVTRVARAAPDGYTLSIGQLNSHVFSGAAYEVRYDLLNDLAPVSLLTRLAVK